MEYTILNIDSAGTTVFQFVINGVTYTCGENFGVLQDITNSDGTINTAGQQLDTNIQTYIQQYLPSSIPASIQGMVGNPQTATQVQAVEDMQLAQQQATPVEATPLQEAPVLSTDTVQEGKDA